MTFTFVTAEPHYNDFPQDTWCDPPVGIRAGDLILMMTVHCRPLDWFGNPWPIASNGLHYRFATGDERDRHKMWYDLFPYWNFPNGYQRWYGSNGFYGNYGYLGEFAGEGFNYGGYAYNSELFPNMWQKDWVSNPQFWPCGFPLWPYGLDFWPWGFPYWPLRFVSVWRGVERVISLPPGGPSPMTVVGKQVIVGWITAPCHDNTLEGTSAWPLDFVTNACENEWEWLWWTPHEVSVGWTHSNDSDGHPTVVGNGGWYGGCDWDYKQDWDWWNQYGWWNCRHYRKGAYGAPCVVDDGGSGLMMLV